MTEGNGIKITSPYLDSPVRYYRHWRGGGNTVRVTVTVGFVLSAVSFPFDTVIGQMIGKEIEQVPDHCPYWHYKNCVNSSNWSSSHCARNKYRRDGWCTTVALRHRAHTRCAGIPAVANTMLPRSSVMWCWRTSLTGNHCPLSASATAAFRRYNASNVLTAVCKTNDEAVKEHLIDL
jgi:hypothetical protein